MPDLTIAANAFKFTRLVIPQGAWVCGVGFLGGLQELNPPAVPDSGKKKENVTRNKKLEENSPTPRNIAIRLKGFPGGFKMSL
jgi:hypothetical protein